MGHRVDGRPPAQGGSHELFGFSDESRGLSTTGRIEKAEEGDLEVEAGDATAFWVVAARFHFLAQDRPDIQFAAKEVRRSMSSPTRGPWASLKRLARHLVLPASVAR